MSQPPPLDNDRPPPPAPTPPAPVQPLQYHDPTPRGYAIPAVWQALIGTIGSGILVVGGGFVIAIVSLIVVSESKAGDAAFYWVAGTSSLVLMGALLLLARRLRRSQLYRGWAIGLYIGMGLGVAFWGLTVWSIAMAFR